MNKRAIAILSVFTISLFAFMDTLYTHGGLMTQDLTTAADSIGDN